VAYSPIFYRPFRVNPCACVSTTGILWTQFTPWLSARRQQMKNDDKDPDDTFSDLLKVLAVVVIIIFVIVGWYFS
jgi:hypothetical protein